MSADNRGAPGADGTMRAELLLATVRDVVASLQRVSELLDHELAELSRGVDPEHSAQLDTLRTENAQLREALRSRAVIEQAKGMLMARHRCDPDTAFGMLVAASRRDGRKLRDVAASMVVTSSGAPQEGLDQRGPSSRSVVVLPDAGRGAGPVTTPASGSGSSPRGRKPGPGG